MDTGTKKRLPENMVVLMAAFVFTLVSFAVFRCLWGVPVAVGLCLATLASQTGTIFLGKRKVLTSLGAASIAAFIALSGYFGAVIFLFPTDVMIRGAGILSGAASFLFVASSTITSCRTDQTEPEALDPAAELDGSDPSAPANVKGKDPEPVLDRLHDEIVLSADPAGQDEEDDLPWSDIFLDPVEETAIETERPPWETGGSGGHALPDKEKEIPPAPDCRDPRYGASNLPGLPLRDGEPPGGVGVSPRYLIYDRRTIQPLGEYVPEGKRPRLDRLTLYRMFPQYDFRTFQIESIRWYDSEVRIFIRGEKKRDKETNKRNGKDEDPSG
jgi:hypothetical protein